MSVTSPGDLALWGISLVAVYKLASLLVGLGFGYMGYRLFLAGIQQPAGDLKASVGNRRLKLLRTAPGTFFVLFGAGVIVATIVQGFDVELPRGTHKILNTLPEHPPMVNDETNG